MSRDTQSLGGLVDAGERDPNSTGRQEITRLIAFSLLSLKSATLSRSSGAAEPGETDIEVPNLDSEPSQLLE